jgi:acyl-CoA thioesterase-1
VRIGRRSRIAVTPLCAALAVVLAYFAGGSVHPASSARTAQVSGATPRHEQVRQQPRTVYHAAATSTDEPVRKPLVAERRATAYAIAFFGDSVSVGYGASRRGHGYVSRVSSWLRTHGKRVVTTNNAKGGVPVAYWMYSPVPKPLDAAVVELGTNDIRLGTTSSQFARAYRTLTSRIRAANPKAQLLCLSVWSRRGSASLEGVINTSIRAVCPGTYVDITGLRDRPYIRSSDGFHPNDAGYRLIAEAVVSKLRLR